MNASLPTAARRIAHLDMDAFFASVELLRHPQLRGQPLVIGGSRRAAGWLGDPALEALAPEQIPLQAFARLSGYAGRGVITTATYEARRFGIGSAMGLMKAARLCPDAYLLPTDFERYRAFSTRFKNIIAGFTPVVEDYGIDEVFIDFASIVDHSGQGEEALARALQKAIHTGTGLTCSIGVAPNKLLAKLASEWNKPNGIFILDPGQVTERLQPLPCRKINGIGPKAARQLTAMGIETIGELARHDLAQLVAAFGRNYGAWLYAVARGHDERALVVQSDPVSVSRETTFARDLHARQDRATLSRVFTWLCEKVAESLQRKGVAGRTVGIKIRFPDFHIATRSVSIGHYTQDASTIRKAAGQCLRRVDLSGRFRLLGVKVENLLPIARARAANQAQEEGQSVQLSLPFD